MFMRTYGTTRSESDLPVSPVPALKLHSAFEQSISYDGSLLLCYHSKMLALGPSTQLGWCRRDNGGYVKFGRESHKRASPPHLSLQKRAGRAGTVTRVTPLRYTPPCVTLF